MKIKRFENIWIMGLILSGAILLFLSILKLIFPSFVIETAQNEQICKIGRYIDTHKWAWYLASSILSFTLYYLSCCACCRKKRLSTKEMLIICAAILFGYAIKEILPQYYVAINNILMILLPCIMKAELFPTTVVYSSVNLLQVFTLEVRNIKSMIADYNFATLLILMIDVYIFEALLYFAFNYRKITIRSKRNGNFRFAALRHRLRHCN